MENVRKKVLIFIWGLLFLLGSCRGEGNQEGNSGMMGNSSTGETTLTAFIQQSASSKEGIWQGWGAKKLYDDTGIKIDFFSAGDRTEQKLKQYIAAGDLPDLIGFRGVDQAQKAMDAELLLPLDDYQELLPNLFENDLYQAAIAYTRQYTGDDKEILYMMPVSVGPAADNAYNWMPMLRWELYKQVGMPEIHTLEDYLDVVEAMVAICPVTESGEKVYGFSLFADWDRYSAQQVSALSFLYGIDTEYVSLLMETNVMTNETASILENDSFYKRALRFYYEANKRGLLDPDSMTQTYSNVETKMSDGRVLFTYYSWLTGTYNSVASGHVNDEVSPDGFANVVASDMHIYEVPDQTIGRNWYFAISKSCKDLEKACELLNWLYDPEVISYLMNGPEGLTWAYDGNDSPYITKEGYEIIDNDKAELMPEEIGGGSFKDGMYGFNSLGLQAATLMENGYTIGYRYWPSVLERNPTRMKEEVMDFLGYDTMADYLQDNNMIAKSTQAVNMIPPLSDEMELKAVQIGEIVKKYSWEMIDAENMIEFEQLWLKMVKEAHDLGMDDIEAYYRDAWYEAIEIADTFQ